MKIKVEIEKTELAPEGVHAATVKAIKDSGGDKCAIKFGFTADENEFIVERSYTAKLDRKSPLTRDAQIVMQRPFNEQEIEGQFDLDTLLGKPCRVVIQHKRSNGGRLKATVETVLEAEKSELPGITGEPVGKKEAGAA